MSAPNRTYWSSARPSETKTNSLSYLLHFGLNRSQFLFNLYFGIECVLNFSVLSWYQSICLHDQLIHPQRPNWEEDYSKALNPCRKVFDEIKRNMVSNIKWEMKAGDKSQTSAARWPEEQGVRPWHTNTKLRPTEARQSENYDVHETLSWKTAQICCSGLYKQLLLYHVTEIMVITQVAEAGGADILGNRT